MRSSPVGSIADAPAIVHHQDVRHGLDGADPLGHHDGGGIAVALKDRLAQRRVGLVVQGGGRIIQNEDFRVSGQRAGDEQPLPLSAGLYEIMTALKNMGCLDNDHSGIVKYYERLAGVEVRPQ